MAQNPEEPIFTAVKNDDFEMVKTLLDGGIDINILEPIKQRTPLYVATLYGHIDIVNLLLKRGAETNTKPCTDTGLTPILEAALLACISLDLKTKCSGMSLPILTKYFFNPSVTRKFLFVIPPLTEDI